MSIKLGTGRLKIRDGCVICILSYSDNEICTCKPDLVILMKTCYQFSIHHYKSLGSFAYMMRMSCQMAVVPSSKDSSLTASAYMDLPANIFMCCQLCYNLFGYARKWNSQTLTTPV